MTTFMHAKCLQKVFIFNSLVLNLDSGLKIRKTFDPYYGNVKFKKKTFNNLQTSHVLRNPIYAAPFLILLLKIHILKSTYIYCC